MAEFGYPSFVYSKLFDFFNYLAAVIGLDLVWSSGLYFSLVHFSTNF